MLRNDFVARLTFALALGAALSVSAIAGAQTPPAPPPDDAPKGTLKTDAASKGNTDVATSGFETAGKPPAEADAKDATDAKISAGMLAAQGNSRSLSVTGAANYHMRRDSEQLTLALAGNYAQAGKAGTWETESVENFQGKARYDHFFVGSFAGFLGVSGRHDRFQGLDFRLNVDPGVAYYFIDEKKHQLWGELGYDFQYDVRRQEFLDAAAAATPPVILDKTQAQHGGRAFVGYANKLNEAVIFNTDLEYVQSLQHSDHFRINWDVGLTSSISTNFSVAATFLLQYDNAPLPNVVDTDAITSISLVYKLL